MLGDRFEEVLSAAQRGSGRAFAELYADAAPAVAGYARLRGSPDPEALTNEVFLGVFRRLPAFSGSERQFRSWVFTIAHRRVLDERRRARARPQTVLGRALQDGAPVGDVEEEALAALGTQRVRELLDRLTDDQRDVLLLRLLGDLTVAQVAAVLGKRPGAVKQLQRRGLDALRAELARRGVTAP